MKLLFKCIVGAFLIDSGIAPVAAQSEPFSVPNITLRRSLADLQGEWLGVARFDDGSELRMGLQIMRIADGSIGANASMLDQGVAYIAVSELGLEGDQIVLRFGASGLTIRGTVSEDGATIAGTGTQRGKSDPVVFRRVAALPPIGRERPQTPKPPYPYDSVDVTFHNEADDVWLAGTLTKPSGDGPYPAVIFIGGSGQNARDYGSDGHRLPHVLADYLARRGFAVLRYDKRGVYQSSGNYATATSADFSRDAVAAHDYLAERPDIDPAKIGYIGHSQGSGVAARAVVAGGGQSGFVVSMAGVGLAPIETLVLQDGTEMAAAGASAAEVATLREFSRKFYATALEGADETTRTRELRALYDALTGTVRETVTRWYGEYGSETYSLNVDVASRDAFVAEKKGAAPTIFWSAVRAPVLVLNGARDSQVPADEHVSAILRALHEQPTNDVDSRIFAGLNHMFQTATTGATDEYSEIDETVSPEVLEVIAGWLIDTTK